VRGEGDRPRVNTDSEAVQGDVACPRQLRPLSGLQLGLDDWFARRHVLARHAVRDADRHRTLRAQTSLR